MVESIAERLDAEIGAIGTARNRLLARVASLLLEVKRGRHFVRLGFGSLADYSKARLSFSARKTTELVELAGRTKALPQIRQAFEAGNVHWTKLRTIARVATAETETDWLARADALSSRQLELAVAEARGECAPKVKVVLELDAEQYADLEDAIRALRRERLQALSREEALVELARRGLAASAGSARPPIQTVVYKCEDCGKLSRETREGPVPVGAATAGRAACDSEIVDGRKPGRISKSIPPAIRRHVLARDRGRCVVPGCSGRDFVEVHHVQPRSQGGSHGPDNLATLCTRHHAAVHEGVLQLDGKALSRETRLSDSAVKLLEALAERPAVLDDLIERTALPVPRASAAAAELELAGLAHRLTGGLFALSGA